MISTKDFKKSWDKACVKLKRLRSDVYNWAWNNQELIRAYTPVIIAVGAYGTKIIVGVLNVQKAEAMKAAKEMYIWDPKMGMYWQIRRVLSNAEKLKIQERFKTGETMGDILESMKILK